MVDKPHTFVAPVTLVGIDGTFPYTIIAAPGILPQAFTADTLILPDINVAATFTCIEVVPVPLAIVTPAGNTHVYEVAANTDAIE